MTRLSSIQPGPSPLSEKIDHRLAIYGMAAAAASVSILALSQPADGEVVITNTNISFRGQVSLDLNSDGVPDVKFNFIKTYGHYVGLGILSAAPAAPGGGIVENGNYASALMRSAKIGPSAHFGGSSLQYVLVEERNCVSSVCSSAGKWGGNHPNRFLGVKFQINGKTHYGWVRITVLTNSQDILAGTITEYGYETIPNRRLLAGLKSKNAQIPPARDSKVTRGASLGMLALGASGLPMWRCDDEVVKSDA